MDCSLPVSSVHGILQARILEWVAMPSCRGVSIYNPLNLQQFLIFKVSVLSDACMFLFIIFFNCSFNTKSCLSLDPPVIFFLPILICLIWRSQVLLFSHFDFLGMSLFLAIWIFYFVMEYNQLRRAWQPTPVFLLGESHGQRSLVGYSP